MKNLDQNSPKYKMCLLGILCAICGLLLSVVNAVTAPKIAQAELAEVLVNLEQIYPDTTYEEIKNYTDDSGLITAVYEAKDAGYVFKIHAVGYNSSGFTFLVGIGNDGTLSGYTDLEQNETSGLGSRAFEDEYKGQINSLKVGDEVPLISGASLTTTAVRNGIEAAYALFNDLK